MTPEDCWCFNRYAILVRRANNQPDFKSSKIQEKSYQFTENIYKTFGSNEKDIHKSVSEDIKHSYDKDVKFVEDQIIYFQKRLEDPDLDERSRAYCEKKVQEYEDKRSKSHREYVDKVKEEAKESRAQFGKATVAVISIVTGSLGVAADIRFNKGRGVKFIPRLISSGFRNR